MQVEIITEDDVSWTATIRFTHNDVVHEDTYNLIAVVPGTNLQLAKQGIQFNTEMKNNVISILTAQIQREIEQGIILNVI
jgi:hypothetical protein